MLGPALSARRAAHLVLMAAAAATPASADAPRGPAVVVAAVGDICDALQECSRTAAVISAIDPVKLILAGDNAYEVGSLAEYNGHYHANYGPFKARTHPVAGNHEYATPGASGYFDYFNGVGVFDGPAGPRDKGYYSVDIGEWHVVALNSNVARGVGSAQEQWLRADLAASTRPCTLASFHHPRFSVGNYTPGDASVQALFQALQDFKADVVVVGHDHNYQRWAPMTAAGANDPANGVRQFVVGTGGRLFYPVGTSPNVEVAHSGTWGVLELTLTATDYAWRFVPVAGGTFTDAGSGACKAKPPVPPQTATVLFASSGTVAPEGAGPAAAVVAVATSDGGPLVADVTVGYATANGTAIAPGDYAATSGTVTFAAGTPGGTTRVVSVPLVSDALDEDDETFGVSLSNPTGAVLGPAAHVVTIADDDPLPTLSAGDCAAEEGNAGAAPCAFAIRLAPASGRAVTVQYGTSAGTATPGTDFQPAAGALTFPIGATERAVAVNVLGDTAIEPDEEFVVDVQSPVNATLVDPQGLGTILDDDAPGQAAMGLAHSSSRRSSLTAGPELYRLVQAPLASYEVIVDEASGDIGPGLLLERLSSGATAVLQSGVPAGVGGAVSLRWQNTLGAPVTSQYARVRSGQCTTDCGPDDVYRVRAYETTLAAGRFNNAGGQRTILVLQAGPASVSGRVYFWSASGALLHAHPFVLGARASLVLDTGSLTPLQQQSGSLTVSHDAPYGALTGKAVAIEPATGFAFDTPLLPRLP